MPIPATPLFPLPKPGYHLVAIPRGELGELSKIEEELEELADAMRQGSLVMAAVELSDLLGAVQSYLARHLPAQTISGLLKHLASKPYWGGAVVAKPRHGDITGIQGQLAKMQEVHALGGPAARAAALIEFLAAVQAFQTRYLMNFTMADFLTFSDITKRAFFNGRRQSH